MRLWLSGCGAVGHARRVWDAEGGGENCQWQFARKLSDGTWLPVVKFRVRCAGGSSQGLSTDLKLVLSKSKSGLQNVGAGGDRVLLYYSSNLYNA
jgi:hypothetical protein